MESLIVPHFGNRSKKLSQSVEIYCDLLEKFNEPYTEPHQFVMSMMNAYYSLKHQPDRSVHGKYFECVIGETLAQQGIHHLYYQAEILHVPLATFDWFLYHDIWPVSISCKTKARD